MEKRTLLLWGISAVAAAVFYALTCSRTFPEAALDLKVTRQEAFDRAREFVGRQGDDLTGFRSAMVFSMDSSARTFLEKELDATEIDRLMMQEEVVPVWWWHVRWFKPLEQEEFHVNVAPDGRLAGWFCEIPEAAPGAALTADEAELIAVEWLAEAGVCVDAYEIVSRSSTDLPHRVDHDFVWKQTGFDCKGATNRIQVCVSGDKVSRYRPYLQEPESWFKNQTKNYAYKETLQDVAAFLTKGLWFATVVILIIGLRRRDMRFMFVGLLFLPLLVLEVLDAINMASVWWMSYRTTMTPASFWGRNVLAVAGSLASAALLLLLAGSAGDHLARQVWPRHVPLSLAVTRRFWQSGPFCIAVFVGLCLASLHLAYSSAFYLSVGWFGGWSPREVPPLNALASPMPWLSAVQSGLGAALNEESLFRLFALTLFVRLMKRTGPALVGSALIWAFLHSTYPQEPFFVRGLELTVVGVAYGLVTMRYGIVAPIVAHYTYNAFTCGLVLIGSDHSYIMLSGIAAGGLGLVLFLPAFLRRLGGRALPTADELLLPVPLPPVVPTQEDVPQSLYRRYQPLSVRRMVVVGMLAIAGSAARYLMPTPPAFGDYVRTTTTRSDAESIADDFMRGRGIQPEEFRRTLWWCNKLDGTQADYVWDQTHSLDALNDTFRTYILSAVHWHVWYFKPLDLNHYQIMLTPEGKLCGYIHRLPEEVAGARLTQDEARAVAEKHLQGDYGVDLSQYRLLSSNTTDRPARTDHKFVWEHTTARIGAGAPRLNAEVQGDEATSMQSYLYIPQDWLRDRQKTGLAVILRQAIVAATFLVMGILVVYLFIVYCVRGYMPPIRMIVSLAITTALFSLTERLGTLPGFWNGYDTRTTPWLYVVREISTTYVGTPFGAFLIAAVLLLAADGFYRQAFPRHIPPYHWFGLGRRQFNEAELARIPRLPYGLVWGEAILAGVLLALAGLVFEVRIFESLMVKVLHNAGPTPDAHVHAACLSDWPIMGIAGKTVASSFLALAGIVLAVSLIKRHLWKSWIALLVVAVVVVIVVTDRDPRESMFECLLGISMASLMGAWGYLAVKYVVRTMPAMLVFVLADGFLAEAVRLLDADDAQVRFNGILLLTPLVVSGLLALIMYARGISRAGTEQNETVAAVDVAVLD